MNSRCTLVIAALLACMYTAPAVAQTSADVKAQASAAAEVGERFFNAGKYTEAEAAFDEADKLVHAPTFVLMKARAQDKLGRLLKARATYQRLVDEKLARGSPAPFVQAQHDAKKELAALQERIPSLQITVTGPEASSVRVTVDDMQVPTGEAIPLDPGEHKVKASAPGYLPLTQTITLQESAKEQLPLQLRIEGPSKDPVDIPETPPDTPARRTLVPALVSFGVAGVGLGVGAVTGAMSSAKVGDLEQQCPDMKCYDDADDTYSSARTLATVSTIGFVVAGVAAVGGVVLLVLDSGGGDPTKTAVTLGPGWLGVKGGF